MFRLRKRPISISTPWFAILASILVPLFSALNAVDVFYFGLDLSSVLAYASSLIIASSLTFLLSIFTLASIRRSVSIAFSICLAITLGNLIGMLSPQAFIVIRPHSGVVDSDHFSYTLTGSLLGLLNGFSIAAMVTSIIKANSKIWRAASFSAIILTIIIISGVMSVLQKLEVAKALMGIGIVIQIIIGYIERTSSNGRR